MSAVTKRAACRVARQAITDDPCHNEPGILAPGAESGGATYARFRHPTKLAPYPRDCSKQPVLRPLPNVCTAAVSPHQTQPIPRRTCFTSPPSYVPPLEWMSRRYFILQVINEPAGSSGKKAKTTKGSSSASDKVQRGVLFRSFLLPALSLCLPALCVCLSACLCVSAPQLQAPTRRTGQAFLTGGTRLS